jgi:hypothetical protein
MAQYHGRKNNSMYIDDEMKPCVHPDRWKWEHALAYVGMVWNSAQLKRNGYKGCTKEYYRKYRFAMNKTTRGDIY